MYKRQVYSTQIYDIRIDSELAEGGYNKATTSFDVATNSVVISMSDASDYPLFLHELVHCFQFEEGRLDFHADKNQKAAPCLYDITDEMEAYYICLLYTSRCRWHRNLKTSRRVIPKVST